MDKNIILQQFSAASKMIQNYEGAELYTGLLDVCGELVNIVSSQIRCSDMDNESVKDIASSLTFIGKGLDNISSTATETDCLKVNTESIQKLEKAVSERKALTERVENANNELVVVEAEITRLKPRADELENKYKIQEALKQTLEKSLEEFSDDKTKALEKSNNELINKLAQLKNEHERLKALQNEYNKNISDLDEKIAALPTEKQLVDDYDKQKAYFERLLSAKEECSEEKQLELREKNAKLENDTKGLEEEMKLLKERELELINAKTDIQTQKGIFETEFIEKLENAMDDLKNHMRSHREVLNGIKDDATELKKHIDECKAVYRNYSFMFDTCKVPLEAIAKASKSEYRELAKSFDINKSEHVIQLKKEVEERLAELDGIIDECTKAITADQSALKAKAFGKENK